MSRIHDALKRAELEKTTHPPAEEGPPTTADWRESLRPEESQGTSPENEFPAGPWNGRGPDALLEQCPIRPWNPDPVRSLFLGRPAHVSGAEEFRTLRSCLILMRERQLLRSVLITSALPEEGKTFVASNLASVIAQQGHRVLLIDLDLRCSDLHSVLGSPRAPGMGEFLSGKADLAAILQRGPQEGLYFIPSGEPTSNANELIGNGRVKWLMESIRSTFDWVIIDSAPILPVADAKLLANLCDGVLMVIGSGNTPHDLARKAFQEIGHGRVIGAVLNRAEAHSAYRTYYYHYGSRAKPPS